MKKSIFLCLFSFILGITLYHLTTTFSTEESKNLKQTTSEVVDIDELDVTVSVDLVKNTKIVASNNDVVISEQKEYIKARRQRKLYYPHTGRLIRIRGSTFEAEDIFCTEPENLMVYYDALLAEIHIRSPMIRIVHHVGLALQKNGYVTHVNNFITEAHNNPVIWEAIKILEAGSSSP